MLTHTASLSSELLSTAGGAVVLAIGVTASAWITRQARSVKTGIESGRERVQSAPPASMPMRGEQ